MRLNTLIASVAGLALCATVAEARDVAALADMEGSGEDGYWEYYEVTDEATLEAFQAIVGKPGAAMANPPAEPVKIAFIYPSQDVSDFWLRNYQAMMARLEEMGIPAEDTQFASDVGDHIVQATYTDQVEQEDFDYVVFGPTELRVQQDNIKRLIDKPDTEVIVWNFTVVPQAWGSAQPLAYLSFSHLAGALIMCDYVLKKLGTEGTMALVRGIPGAIDDQRSGGFRDCVTGQSDWQVAYEHVGMFERERGYTGTQQILQAYPEVELIHNANTAMAMGSISAVQEAGSDVKVTAWGGTGDELEALRHGELWATPMRMSDDVGVATAEVVRAHLEGRTDDIPLVSLGRITIVSGETGADVVDAMEREAFRYTGIGTLER
ncbi:MAG: substrate-binding domain-containing protein [Immundisolibacterales bacterium]|nr:substrate-binding domain-containing protein [Immundisolibacterales bacterium]